MRDGVMSAGDIWVRKILHMENSEPGRHAREKKACWAGRFSANKLNMRRQSAGKGLWYGAVFSSYTLISK